jgi:hypothetical protein
MAPDQHPSRLAADSAEGVNPSPGSATATPGPMGPRAVPGAQLGPADRARASAAAQGLPEYVEDPEALADVASWLA